MLIGLEGNDEDAGNCPNTLPMIAILSNSNMVA